MYEEIFLLCHRALEHFTVGKTYHGTRLESDTWEVKNDRGEIYILHYSQDCPYHFYHAFYPNDFKSVCNSHPDLIEPQTFEFTVTFNWHYDHSDSINTGEKTVDALDPEEAFTKVKKHYPNVYNQTVKEIS